MPPIELTPEEAYAITYAVGATAMLARKSDLVEGVSEHMERAAQKIKRWGIEAYGEDAMQRVCEHFVQQSLKETAETLSGLVPKKRAWPPICGRAGCEAKATQYIRLEREDDIMSFFPCDEHAEEVKAIAEQDSGELHVLPVPEKPPWESDG